MRLTLSIMLVSSWSAFTFLKLSTYDCTMFGGDDNLQCYLPPVSPFPGATLLKTPLLFSGVGPREFRRQIQLSSPHFWKLSPFLPLEFAGLMIRSTVRTVSFLLSPRSRFEWVSPTLILDLALRQPDGSYHALMNIQTFLDEFHACVYFIELHDLVTQCDKGRS